MRVDEDTATAIAAGHIFEWRLPAEERTVTPTRRVRGVKRVHRLPPSGHVPETRPLQVGQVVPITRYGRRRPVAHVTIVSCRRGQHGQTLTPDSLLRLGHDDLAGYAAAWLLRRDAAWVDRNSVSATKDDLTTAMLERWHERWAERLVWAIEWDVLDDLPTFLRAASPRIPYAKRPSGRQMIDDGIRDEDRGYFGSGVRDIPAHTERSDRGLVEGEHGALFSAGEYVDPTDLKPHWADTADELHLEALPRKSVVDRLLHNLRNK